MFTALRINKLDMISYEPTPPHEQKGNKSFPTSIHFRSHICKTKSWQRTQET